MKQLLIKTTCLFVAVILCGAWGVNSLFAQNQGVEYVYHLEVIDEVAFAFDKISVSANGKYIAGSKEGKGIIHDTESLETTLVERTDMAGDYIADVTNEGMIVGNAGAATAAKPACKTMEGEWTLLSNNTKDGGSCDATNSDGSVLGGNVLSLDVDTVYLPCLWLKQESGSYLLEMLPMPEADSRLKKFEGAKVVDISSDGEVILGLYTADAANLQYYTLVWKKEGDSYVCTELGKEIACAGATAGVYFLPNNMSLSGDGKYASINYVSLNMDATSPYFYSMFQHVAVYDLVAGLDNPTVLSDYAYGEVDFFGGKTEGDLWTSVRMNDGTSFAVTKGKSSADEAKGLVFNTATSKMVDLKDWILDNRGIDIYDGTDLTLSGCPFASPNGEIVGGAYTKGGETTFYYIRQEAVVFDYELEVVDDITAMDKISVSANGKYIAGSKDGKGIIHDTETLETTLVERTDMAGDYIADVSNDGMIVGNAGAATTAKPAYKTMEGEWSLLPNNTKDGGSCDATNSDGSVLGGNVLSLDVDSVYLPCLWLKQESGSYLLEMLPMPEADSRLKKFEGAKVVDISSDGEVILGLYTADAANLQYYTLVWKKEGDSYVCTELGKEIACAGATAGVYFLPNNMSLSGDGKYASINYVSLNMDATSPYFYSMFQHVAVYDLVAGLDNPTVLSDYAYGEVDFFGGKTEGDLWTSVRMNDGTSFAVTKGKSSADEAKGLVFNTATSKMVDLKDWILDNRGIDIYDGTDLTLSGCPFASPNGEIVGGAYTKGGEMSFYYIRKVYPPNVFMITATAEGEGEISPSGEVEVIEGENQTFSFTPAEGYRISEVLVDGMNVEEAVTAGAYTFEAVADNHTIEVKFVIKTYTISPSVTGKGSISPSEVVTLNHGENKTFTFTPAEGYRISEVLIDGTNIEEAVTAGAYTFEAVADNHTIEVKFVIKTYTISPSVTGKGSISPSEIVTLNHGENKTFTFTPAEGYRISEVLVDGTNVEEAVTAGTYTFEAVADNHTIEVKFVIKTYTISPSVTGNGSISPSEVVTLNHGDNKTFTFTPAEGYRISEVLIDGTNVEEAVTAGTYTFEAVADNHTIKVVFEEKTSLDNIYDSEFAVYPNPTTGFLTVKKEAASIVSVFDYTGRKVLETQDVTLNISHLPEGIYFVKLNNMTVKVLKQ